MGCSAEMSSGTITQIQSSIKFVSCIQKLLRGNTQTYRQQGDFTSLLLYFQSKASRIKLSSGKARDSMIYILLIKSYSLKFTFKFAIFEQIYAVVISFDQ
jgi:hypothetical protein